MIGQWFTSPEWINVVEALLHTLWLGAVIAVLLGLVLRCCDKPVVRYRCSLAALGSVVLTGLIAWALLNRPVSPPVFNSPVPQKVSVTAPAVKNNSPALIVNFSPPELKPAAWGWMAWLGLFWLAGALAMILRAGIQLVGAEKLRRAARPLEEAHIVKLLTDARQSVGLVRRVRLAMTEQLTSPIVIGVWLPIIILPLSLITTLTPEQIRFVLLHELAHIRRGDYFASLFQLFVEALLFFNPAVWWISRQMRNEREACCDELAIALSGAPADYARTLIQVAEKVLSPMPPAIPAFGDRREPSSLADRVQRLLVPGYRPQLRLTWRAMLAALVAGGGLLFFSALGTRAAVAAILSPQQRIARIEQKMTEYGQPPVAENFNPNDEQVPKIKISGRIRLADSARMPKWIAINFDSKANRSSSGMATYAKKGLFTNQIQAGMIYISVEVSNYAPAQIGPLDGRSTNSLENLQLVCERGFDVPLQVVDMDSGNTLTNATVATFFSLNTGSYSSHLWKSGTDGAITLTHCADLPLNVTANAPGYEIVVKQFDHVRPNEPLRVELRRGGILSGTVLSRTTGEPVAGAELHLLYQADGEGSGQYHQWDNSLYGLGKSAADGAFSVNQLRNGLHYSLGISAPGYASLILTNVSTGSSPLTIQLGPKLIVRGHVVGDLNELTKIGNDPVLTLNTAEVYGNNSYGVGQNVPVRVTNGVATFQFTNHVAGQVTLTGKDYQEERDVNAPIADWVVDLNKPHQASAKFARKREVIFRFQSASGVSPAGTVLVSIPKGIGTLTVPDIEMPITNGEVRAVILIGGFTLIQPKQMVGFWFDHWRLGNDGQTFIEVTNGTGPQIVNIPVIPAGAIYARARNVDGTPAGGLMFNLDELKRAPSRDDNGPLSDNSDSFSDNAPRKWVSGALPLGGTYRVDAWRGNSFCVSPPIKLTGANPDAEVELQFPPVKTFAGTVLAPDGKPLSNVGLKISFVLLGNHSFDLKSVYTDEQGRFQLENVTPDSGTYSVEADAPGMMAESVKLDFTSQPQIIRLQRGRTLGGRVVEVGTGYVIPGEEVRVADYNRTDLPMLKTHTDADGRFEFNTLGDGHYAFYLSDGQLTSNKRFRANENTNLVLAVKLYSWSKVKAKSAR